MNESMLNSLMRLFAIMVSINRGALHVVARNFVESFLIQQFSQNLADRYLLIFDEYARELESLEKGRQSKKISAWSVKILGICNQIVEELHITHRFMILLSLLRFTKYFSEASLSGSDFSNTISDAVRTIADGLMITDEEFENCSAFIKDKFYNVPRKDRLLIISDDHEFMEGEVRHLQKTTLWTNLCIQDPASRYLSFSIHWKGEAGQQRKVYFPEACIPAPKGRINQGRGDLTNLLL